MPRALELEEFGLEVEEEQHALMGDTAADMSDSSTTHRRTQLVALSTPSKEQRSLLQSVNVRPTRLLRPLIVKWATILIALALVVFLNLGQESEEASYLEEALPVIDTCEDDDIAFTNMFKSENNCFEFVLASSKHGKTERCNIPIGIPDENEFQKLLKHFCRKSCGLCGTSDEDPLLQGEKSGDKIKASVEQIAGEIEEKESQVKMEEEREERAREKQLAKEIEEEIDAQEEELSQNSVPGSKPSKGEDEKSPNTNKGGDIKKPTMNATITEDHLVELPCQDEHKSYCVDLSNLNSTLRTIVCNSPIDDDADEAIEAPQKLIQNICRMSCGMCGNATGTKDGISVEEEQVKESNVSGNEKHKQQEKKAATAKEASGSKLMNGDSSVDGEVEQSNDDESASTATEELIEDNDDNGGYDDYQSKSAGDNESHDNDQSKSAVSGNKLRKGGS